MIIVVKLEYIYINHSKGHNMIVKVKIRLSCISQHHYLMFKINTREVSSRQGHNMIVKVKVG